MATTQPPQQNSQHHSTSTHLHNNHESSGSGKKTAAFCIADFLCKGTFDLDGDGASAAVNSDFEIPFITPLRADRLGYMADWSGEGQGSAASASGAQAAEEDGQWSLFLENSGGGNKFATVGGRRNSRSGPSGGMPSSSSSFTPSAGGRQQGRKPFQRDARRIIRDPSVSIETDWKLVDEVEFSRLSKLSFAPADEPKVVQSIGTAPAVDASFDRLQAKQERPLGVLEQSSQKTPSVLNDPTLQSMIEAEIKTASRVIVSSDVVLSMLMSSTRTVLPWDIFFTSHPAFPENKVVVIDKRDASDLDSCLVNETKNEYNGVEENKESVNYYTNLAIEATRINANLPALLSSTAKSASSPKVNYVRWDMGDGLVLLVRGEVNAVSADGQKSVLLRALLEYEWGRGAMDWRQRLDVQRASVLAAELKNNSAQLCRWICSAVLLSVDRLKVAFVSRQSPRDRTRHAILGVHDIEPYEFADQMGIDIANGFGIVKSLALRFFDGDDMKTANNGRTVIMRDPQKPMLRIYLAPATPVGRD